MIEIDALCWKQIVTFATAPEYEGPVIQRGDDTEQQYVKDAEVVARMMIYGANTDQPAYLNERKFWATEEMIESVKDIEVLTDEQWQEIDDDYEGDPDAWRADQ